ncbi:melanoma-associated antigen B10-like [Piliocolobus tephrosceles]|uniref:Melanoma-associated antigen B10-like n=1 Tax=Piliocolobus tephrosceles TaxID=591936 RepID=A0A8C9I975_9PRIM|nr:melanoma-associated antigen B10-like [Piliocolobus tephrosceles]
MPRGQKSKLRAREKRRQAREEPEPLMDAQATARVGIEFSSSSSAHFSSAIQSSTAPKTTSNPHGPQRATSTTTTAAAVSYLRSNESTNNQTEERPRSSQALAANEHMTRSPVDETVFILVHYLLYKYQMKELIIKAAMLRDIVQIPRRYFSEILRKVSDHLEMVFGLDLKEVDPDRHIYFLINKLVPTYDAKLSEDRRVPRTGMLMTILGVIFTNGNCATEEQIWQVLNVMGLYEGRRHFIFGEPKKIITQDFVRENYLQYQQVPNSDPPRYQFLWGPRAHVETTKMKVLEFLAKIHNTVPSAFPTWYEEALKDEEERAQARLAARARIRAVVNARSQAIFSRFSHP